MLAEKRTAKEKERLKQQKEGQQDLKESIKRAEMEDKELMRNDQQRRDQFYQSLTQQVEDERQRRKN